MSGLPPKTQAICRATAAPRWNCPRSREVRCVKGRFWALHIYGQLCLPCVLLGENDVLWGFILLLLLLWCMMWLHFTWPRPKKGFRAWQKIMRKRMSTWMIKFHKSSNLSCSSHKCDHPRPGGSCHPMEPSWRWFPIVFFTAYDLQDLHDTVLVIDRIMWNQTMRWWKMMPIKHYINSVSLRQRDWHMKQCASRCTQKTPKAFCPAIVFPRCQSWAQVSDDQVMVVKWPGEMTRIKQVEHGNQSWTWDTLW